MTFPQWECRCVVHAVWNAMVVLGSLPVFAWFNGLPIASTVATILLGFLYMAEFVHT